MSGIFYGVGVGPGDPELLTLKAIKIIKECDVLAVAVSAADFLLPYYDAAGAAAGNVAGAAAGNVAGAAAGNVAGAAAGNVAGAAAGNVAGAVAGNVACVDVEDAAAPETRERLDQLLEKCVAYKIALAALPEIAGKAKLFLPMPMKKDKAQLKQIHDLGAEAAAKVLRENRSIACITLGDPSVYSTCLYIQKRLRRMGYETRLVPGIPSFCAAAARLNEGLAENKEELHVLPASYGIEEGLELKGTKVLMKAGKKMPYVKEVVREKKLQICMVENCGMESERVYESVEEIPDEASYYSLLIVKE